MSALQKVIHEITIYGLHRTDPETIQAAVDRINQLEAVEPAARKLLAFFELKEDNRWWFNAFMKEEIQDAMGELAAALNGKPK